jgi:two-component system chemotaxis sensor kinase CheA
VLPLTLAILDGMSVVGSEIFILPLNFVMESLQPSRTTSTRSATASAWSGARRIPAAGRAARGVLGRRARTDPCQGIVTIMETEGRRFALLIDELVGQQQVVVKNLETNYRKVHGISARRSWATAASR